jgi:hypothetical protein
VLRAGDVNAEGTVSSSDALRIVNELARRAFSEASTQQLVNPATLTTWPAAYFDHNADNRVTALDALRVVNDLARQATGGEGESNLAFIVSSVQSSGSLDPSRDELWMQHELRRHYAITERPPKQTGWNATVIDGIGEVEGSSSASEAGQDKRIPIIDAALATWPTALPSI